MKRVVSAVRDSGSKSFASFSRKRTPSLPSTFQLSRRRRATDCETCHFPNRKKASFSTPRRGRLVPAMTSPGSSEPGQRGKSHFLKTAEAFLFAVGGSRSACASENEGFSLLKGRWSCLSRPGFRTVRMTRGNLRRRDVNTVEHGCVADRQRGSDRMESSRVAHGNTVSFAERVLWRQAERVTDDKLVSEHASVLGHA